MIRATLAVVIGVALAGCGAGGNEDLRAWMDEQGKGARGNVEPLPQIRTFEQFTYNAYDLPDPFRPRKIEVVRPVSRLSPDVNRRKEPLESFPLETLKMVGTLQQGKQMQALVQTSEKDIYRVRVGNYMGQNYGVIVSIDENEVKLKELVQDSGGDWTERTSTLLLAEADNREKKK